MKKISKVFIITLLTFSMITIKGFAIDNKVSNVELVGNANGLVFIPGNEPFLYSDNIVPGDKIKRTIVIKNNHEDSYELFMKAERGIPKEEFDLLNKLNLKVTYKDEVIYEGPASGEDSLSNNISLGVFNSGDKEDLVAEVEFDGPSIGNEFKDKSAEVNWIFTAVKEVKEEIENKPNLGIGSPNTGDKGISLYVVLFLTSMLALIKLNKKI
ncbi:MAG: LPXTG cell wall anchor domain-containing protein [Clostridium septicum]|uniref:LPXTG cell wall anchor domain-containing protein n=2 Tax=Clostridium TaxID=1485 RepID=UPI002903C663|nr:LPXTG cell wall anchor domain-containing protein [Clostridium septicum]MDU1313712.1 LPXTG cell wall anchor domain-containing protein [Clostridium septicum]